MWGGGGGGGIFHKTVTAIFILILGIILEVREKQILEIYVVVCYCYYLFICSLLFFILKKRQAIARIAKSDCYVGFIWPDRKKLICSSAVLFVWMD